MIGFLVVGEGGMGVTENKYGISFWKDKNVLKLTVVIIAQLCEYTKKH